MSVPLEPRGARADEAAYAARSADPSLCGPVLADDTATIHAPPCSPQVDPANKSAMEPLLGTVLRSRYRLEQVIGRGGTSVVFSARDLQRAVPASSAGKSVALKLLRADRSADPLALARLKREFRQMQCLSHPGIVRVFDLECDADLWFMTMELMANRTVKTWIQRPASRANALRIIRDCCQALHYAHSLGIVHGDLKPTNVMVSDDGSARLIDFASHPGPGEVAATPLYASPQILSGHGAERRDDVFSLACLSYFILSAGRHPFGGRPSLEDGRAKSAPDQARQIPAGLFEVIERGLSAERERRPASAEEFMHDLSDADRRGRATVNSVVPLARGSIGAHPRQPQFVHMLILSLATVATACLLPLATHRDITRVAELPRAALAAIPEMVAAPAQAETAPASRPPIHDSGIISFDTSTVHASAVQSLVAISVKRMQAKGGHGAFVWRVERGTAHPGVDYEPIEPQVVRFIEGQAVRTLFIPLIHGPAELAPHGPRTFTVMLQRVAGGPALGRFARVTVAIDPAPAASPISAYQARAGR
jgi:tRNA A-37 threonylcarbamoyl transferase component Bud32